MRVILYQYIFAKVTLLKDLYQFHAEPGSPIYQQLTDYISSGIRSGELENGTQLPTVRELADSLQIARGTIKRVYDELETAGLVEKMQGRGTFISYCPPEKTSRKEVIMQEIDNLLDIMESMDFSWQEIRIFLDLKLRQRTENRQNVRAAVIECNPEVLTELTRQLQELPNLDLDSFLLDDVSESPYKLTEDYDLIITTMEHAPTVEKMTQEKRKIAKIALRLLPNCVAHIVKLGSSERVGIVCSSRRFGQLLYDFCMSYTDCEAVDRPAQFHDFSDLSGFLHEKTVVLVPENYEKYCSDVQLSQLREYRKTHPVIECAYGIDEGSFMYVRERIERHSIKKQKT